MLEKYAIIITGLFVNFKDVLGWLFIITATLDGVKYHWQSSKIRRFKTSKGHSRKFINAALLNGIIRLFYALAIVDGYLFWSSLVALICMTELFFSIYRFYPFTGRNLPNFRRPSVLTYFLNSILPNKWTKRL